MISGPFYTYRRMHFTIGNASFFSVTIREGRLSQSWPPGRVITVLVLNTICIIEIKR